MDNDSGSRPLRQWRILIHEDGAYNCLFATLSWRTFPCRWDHWDGHATFTFPRADDIPILTQEALRAVLGQLAAEPWKEGIRPRYNRP